MSNIMRFAIRMVPVAAGMGLASMLSTQAGALLSSVEARGQKPASEALSTTAQWNGDSSRALLDGYCVTCHNTRAKTADLMLDTLDLKDLGANGEAWEKVVRKVRAGLMPPAGQRRPERHDTNAFASWLETSIDAAAAKAPDPGRALVRRLNRREYQNAIRDLLGLEVNATELLPSDPVGYGFDNIGDVLSSTSTLMERYVIAAQKISRSVLDVPDLVPSFNTFSFSATIPQEPGPKQDLPLGARGVSLQHEFPADGEYEFKITMGRGGGGVVRESSLELRIDGERVKAFPVRPQQRMAFGQQAAGGMDVRLPIKKGKRTISLIFPQYVWKTEGMGPSRMPSAQGIQAHMVGGIVINGPFAAKPPDEHGAAWRRVMVCQPRLDSDEIPCAKKIFTPLVRRAYRRPIANSDVEPFMAAFRSGRSEGGFEAGVQLALEGILIDPEFIFRVEQAPPRAARTYRISDVDLASRLSFFLWSSIPDDELLNLAAAGRLSAPKVLEQQVRRMLRDERANALTHGFFGQWLGYTRIASATPDRAFYPWFDEKLQEAMQQETDLFLRAQIVDDRGALELLSADYTYVDEQLAKLYRLPNVYGSGFRRVALADGRRAGILGHGSVLTTTSYATRTSPVIRAKWLLDTLLGTPPPPPPANVPAFEESAATDGKPISVRQQMERHRKNPVCASCHSMLDPLGFALENFDGIGQWRDKEKGVVVDPSGSFPNGSKFDGPAAFRNVLLEQREAFLTTATEKLLTYALGRGVEYRDMPVVRQIIRDAAPQNHRWSALVLGIVKSVPFQMKRGVS